MRPFQLHTMTRRHLAAMGYMLLLLLLLLPAWSGHTRDHFWPGTGFITSRGLNITPLRTVRVGTNPAIVAVDARDRHVFVVNEGALVADKTGETLLPVAPGNATMIDEATGRVLRTMPVGQTPVAVAVNMSARRVFVLNAGRIDTSAGVTASGSSVTILDAMTGAAVRTVNVGRIPVTLSAVGAYPTARQALAVDPLTRQVFVVVPTGLIVLDGATGTIRRRIALDGAPSLVTVDSQARRVYVGNAYDDALASAGGTTGDASSGSLAVLDLDTDRALANVALTQNRVAAMAVDRHLGRVLLVGLAGNSAACGVVEMFDARTGKHLQAIPLVARGTYRNGECAVSIDSATNRAFVLYTAGSYDLGRGTYMSVSTLDTRGNRLVGTVELLQSNETRGTFLNRSVVVDERDNRVFAAAAQGESGLVKGSILRVLDARTGRVAYSLGVSTGPQDAAIDEGARRLFVTNGHANTLDVFDASHL